MNKQFYIWDWFQEMKYYKRKEIVLFQWSQYQEQAGQFNKVEADEYAHYFQLANDKPVSVELVTD